MLLTCTGNTVKLSHDIKCRRYSLWIIVILKRILIDWWWITFNFVIRKSWLLKGDLCPLWQNVVTECAKAVRSRPSLVIYMASQDWIKSLILKYRDTQALSTRKLHRTIDKYMNILRTVLGLKTHFKTFYCWHLFITLGKLCITQI